MHCAASCNDTAICTALVQHGAAIFATTLSDGATAIEKCDPYREGYADCATYLAGARLASGGGKEVVGTQATQLVTAEGEGARLLVVGEKMWGLYQPGGRITKERRWDGPPAGELDWSSHLAIAHRMCGVRRLPASWAGGRGHCAMQTGHLWKEGGSWRLHCSPAFSPEGMRGLDIPTIPFT